MYQPFKKVRLWQTHFSVLRPMQNLIIPELVVYEKQHSREYCYDGRKRFEDGSQIVITMCGRGAICVDGSEYALTPGKAFLHNYNDPEVCYFYPADGVEAWEFLWLAFYGGNSAELVREINENHGYIFELPENSSLIKTLMEYKSYSGELQILSALEGSLLVSSALKELCQPGEQTPMSANALLVGAVQNLINSDPGQDLQVSSIADSFNISREHLSRIFVQETTLTIHEYIIRIRLKLAQGLLLHTRLSSKEIADRCGWKDYSNFYRIFKMRFGYSPQQVRSLGIRPQQIA